ncbi:Carbonic anhydrase [Pleurotus pulmonarius]|nr:hypothetical protein EYR36_004690 [Pleurotus pulmonarius]KAF4578886.1 hypothetical protein EYR36_000694 [Pleurotus pulmonarius]
MAESHQILSQLLTANEQWAQDVDHAEPEFFKQCAAGQSPTVLWIGCADSRVPESVVTGARPGEIFVHRNIANQFHPDDDSAQAVLTYAVDHLGVEHVVVVGHTECGGAAACFQAACAVGTRPGPVITVPTSPPDAAINKWLAPMTSLAASLHLSTAPASEAVPILVEENVKMQVKNLSKTSTITAAWANKSPKGKEVWVHGWVYDIAAGKLRDLGISLGPPKRA